MRTLHPDGHGKSRIIEVDQPVPNPDQVLIKTVRSALCGSELKSYRGDGIPGGNMGHEAIGIVAALGKNVTGLREGDRVGVSAIAGCGRSDCTACQKGQSTWCSRLKFYTNMHAEAFLTEPSACLPLPPDVPDDVGVLITGDGLGVPYHTSRKIAGDDIKTIVIFGLGPIGLGNVLVQSYLGRKVIAVDLSPERRRLALDFGAAEALDAHERDVVGAIHERVGRQGVDVAIEAAGNPVTAKHCFRVVRTEGLVVFNGEIGSMELSPGEDFIRWDVRAVGSWFFQVGEYPEMLKMYRAGLPIQKLVTDHYPFQEAVGAFEAFGRGTTGKVLLTY